MPSVPFSEVLGYLEAQGFVLVGIHGNIRIFVRSNGLTRILRVEVSDKHVSAIDFKEIKKYVEHEEDGPRWRRGRA